MVSAAARRQHPVRREPAEEIRGHLSLRLRDERLAGALAGAKERLRLLGAAGRPHLPRRQPAHQAVPLLGVGHRGDQARLPGHDVSRRGLYPATADGTAGEERLHSVLHLLRLEDEKGRYSRLLHGADVRAPQGLLPAQRLAEHAGHPDRVPRDGWPLGLRRTPGTRSNAFIELWHLRPSV